MNVGQMIEYLKNYDEDEEVEVEVRFGEVGESYSSTFDVVPFSHEEVEGGDRNPWPAISANVGFGVMTEAELRLLVEYVRGIGRKLERHGSRLRGGRAE